MAFTPEWGTYTRNRPTDDTDEKIEVLVVDGIVASVSAQPGQGQLEEGSFALVGRGEGVTPLASLAVGDAVSIEYDVRSTDDQRIRAAASGRQMLVAGGVPLKPRIADSDPEPHPRTAIGFSEDGSRMYMLTVDGRQPEFSTGVSLDELAEMMVELGAYTALNLDGGGSTTMVARQPGAEVVELVNRPSEIDDDEVRSGNLTQRPVPDGLGLFVPEGSGDLAGFWLETAVEPERATGGAFVPRLRTDRVFPGLTRTITATPYDEMYSPAELPAESGPSWKSDDPRVGRVDRSGVFTAKAPGETTVTASLGNAEGEFGITVLGELARIEASSEQIDLKAGDPTATFDVIGFDDAGYSAPIEPADVQLSYDEAALDIEVTDKGEFEISGDLFTGTELVELAVEDLTITVPVTFGLEEVVVDDFETTDSWNFWSLRASGEFSVTSNGFAGSGGQLDYDFTQSGETRGAGVWPVDDLLEIAGEPEAFRLKVNSDRAGLRARLEIVDANGTLRTVEPGFIEATGWQEITYAVPDNVVYPIKLRRIYFNEIDPTASYHGTTVIDELSALQPEPVELEEIVVDSFESTESWDLWTLRASGEWSGTTDGFAGSGGQLTYDFTQSDLTRGIGVWPADGHFAVPGKPTQFQLRVKADPPGLRARIEIVDALGVLRTVQPGFVEEPGWQELTYQVPNSVVYPIKLRRIYFNEIDPTASYHGTMVIDELTALTPKPTGVEQSEPVTDPLVEYGTQGKPGDWTFAVVSDLGVSADDPEGAAVQEARRTLGEMRDRGAGLVIVNGGLVAEGTAANFAFARRLLDDELTGVDYYYVPGEAERGEGSLAAFEAEFGTIPQVVDHRGVRFLLLDTTEESYRKSDWTQLPLIRDQLADASNDRDIASVVVVQSLPLRDVVPPYDVQLDDRKEAATLEWWLTEFREQSRKGAVLIGGAAGAFSAQRIDGVPQATNGAGSVAAVADAAYGGFAGWSLWEVGRKIKRDGMRVEFVPRADSLTVTAPATVAVGSTATVEAVITQGDEAVGVGYPMAAMWSGSKKVHIGSAKDAGRDHVAAFDPRTGTLTALGVGTIKLGVTVNSQTENLEIELTE
nr:phosphodiester glycosidase family protein [Phytoactinopolyspora alkaliphila]